MLRQVVSIVLFFTTLMSFGADFIAGKDYEVINEKSPLEKKYNAITVTEFFSYGCPWCARIETSLNTWVNQQGKKILFQKVPVVFNKDWAFYAKAYYTLKALSLNSKLDSVLFKAIIQDKRALHSNQSMIDFLTKQGIDKDIMVSAFENSPQIEMSLNAGLALMSKYHINAVPAFVVNKQYKTDLQMTKTEERLFATLDYLLAKANHTTSQ